MAIKDFRGQYRWLSNFHMIPVDFEGLTYPSTEHAYQAAKFSEHELREAIQKLPKPAESRKAGQLAQVDEVWHTVRKFQVMERVLREKFKDDTLRQKLIDTGDEELVEGNTWHDNCWGSCVCLNCGNKGENRLGKLLMKLRKELNDNT